MLNQVVLVGKLESNLQEGSLNRSWFILGVQRDTKGTFAEEYPVDHITVYIRESIIEQDVLGVTYGGLGRMVAVKGKLEVENNELLLIADRIAYLADSEKGMKKDA